MFPFLRQRGPSPILAILTRPFGFHAPCELLLFGFPIFLTMSVSEEGYSSIE